MSDLETLGDLTLSDVCAAAVVLDEGGGAYTDSSVVIPGRDGAVIDPEGSLAPLTLSVEFVPKYTDAGGTPGFGHLNLSKLKAQLGKPQEVALVRTVENIGQVRAMVKQFAPLVEQRPNVYQTSLFVASGSWQDASESSNTGNPPTVVTGGDREIWDPRLSISAAGQTQFTLSDGTVYTITAAAGTFPIVIDVGAGTVTAGGSDASGRVTFSHEHWFRLEADATASITTDNTVTVFWRNRWA